MNRVSLRQLFLVCKMLAVASGLLLVPMQVCAAVYHCAAGDVGCVSAAIGKGNTNRHPHNTLFLQAGTYQPDRVDNTGPEGPNAFPVITKPLRIVGEGADQTVLLRAETAPLMRFFQVAAPGTLTLDAVTLRGGEVDRRFFLRGGCILSRGDPLIVRDSVLEECAAWVGGAIDQTGALLFQRFVLQNNLSDLVGALAVRGPVTGPVRLEDGWVSDNSAQSEAGIAIDPTAGDVVIRRCTIKDNIGFLNAGGGVGGLGSVTMVDTLFLGNFGGIRGGAASLTDGTVTLRRVTCLDNSAEHFGGCLDVQDADVDIEQSTITENTAGARIGGAGGGIYHQGDGRVTLTQMRLFNNQAPQGPDCFGEIERGRGTVIGDPTGCTVIEVPGKDVHR